MIQQKALNIFPAKRTVWFWFAGKELLRLEPVNAVDLFIKLSKMTETAHVQLKSQQKSRIKGREVIRFTLAIELAAPAIKQTLNLNNQK